MKRQAHHAHEVRGIGKAHLQPVSQGGLLHGEVQPVAGVGLAVLVGVLPALHGNPRKLHFFPVPHHGQVVLPRLVQVQQQRQVAVHIDFFPVDGRDAVPHLQGLLEGAAVGKAPDNGLDHGFHAAIEAQDNKQARKEIHPRPGGKDQQLRPKALVFQGPGIAGGLVLPLHGAESAEGKAPQSVQSLPLLPLANGRAHADGELIHPHAAGLGGHKMPQLVYGDEHAEHQRRD